MDDKSAKLSLSIVDGVIKLSADIDIIEALRELAKKSDNTIDDKLVSLVEAAKDNLDWKGLTKEIE